MFNRHLLLYVACVVSIAACAPVVQGGPPLTLGADLQDTARLGRLVMSSDWLDSEADFADTFTDEVGEELRRCMGGAVPLDVRIHLDRLDRGDRLATWLNGGGAHRLSGTVEFVDPRQGHAVVGRLPVSALVHEGGGLGALLADRQMLVSEAFGRAVCEAGFGRNPRVSGPSNATAG